MRAHTVTTKAWDGARARTTRTILALSLAVVLVAATASTASAHRPVQVGLDPQSVGFGDRQVGTATAQAFTLNVRCPYGRCSTTFNPRISVSGDYAQTNNCPPTVPQSQDLSCTINVTFTPTSSGSKDGTLSTGRGICVKRPHRPDEALEPCAGPTATLTGTGVTTPTPPTRPLTLHLRASRNQSYRLPAAPSDHVPDGGLTFSATTNHDSTLVARGNIERTVVQLAGGVGTEIKARLKHPKRLNEKPKPGKPKAKIKVAATDVFGQTAIDKLKVSFIRDQGGPR